jgi:hypothetical protein
LFIAAFFLIKQGPIDKKKRQPSGSKFAILQTTFCCQLTKNRSLAVAGGKSQPSGPKSFLELGAELNRAVAAFFFSLARVAAVL